jgi:hypothetical protein
LVFDFASEQKHCITLPKTAFHRSMLGGNRLACDERESMHIPDDSRSRGIALIEEVLDELSSISARAMSGTTDEDPSAVYTACGDMQIKLQEAIELLQAFPVDRPTER